MNYDGMGKLGKIALRIIIFFFYMLTLGSLVVLLDKGILPEMLGLEHDPQKSISVPATIIWLLLIVAGYKKIIKRKSPKNYLLATAIYLVLITIDVGFVLSGKEPLPVYAYLICLLGFIGYLIYSNIRQPSARIKDSKNLSDAA